MKKNYLFFALCSLIILVSCTKTNHTVRVTNQYPKGISNLTIGPASFGSVASGNTTNYISIPEGSSAIYATIDSTNMYWKGTVSVDGKGEHKWTVTLDNLGGTSIKEDK